jgi:cold shock CspA family protein
MVETKTSRQLLDEVFYPVQMYQRIEQNNSDYITKLFVPDRNLDKSQPLFNFRNESIIGSYAGDTKEYESSIFSINKNGFGFIKNEEINNIFFHYSTIANKDFSELQPGMRVKYTQEEDTERSKREGAPRYRACSVSIIE